MKTTPSKAAKVAAIMAFASNITSYAEALAVYDWLVNPKRESLKEAFPEICWWYPISVSDADIDDWAIIVKDVAENFDRAVKHFKAQ